ncbi:invasion associated locus B family protein [Bartonella australis]|nr:invasion associated locus B family protein [Bartonella australis]
MSKNWNITASFLFIFILLSNSVGFADEKDNIYTVHPPRLSVPRGKPGETRRVIMQFNYWTLICDENRVLKQGICNVTQTIHDKEDQVIFSWSLVSTKSGQPVMLFRAMSNADTKIPIKLLLDGVKEPLWVNYKQCDETVCLAQLAVGPTLSKQIEQKKNVRISYKIKNGKTLSFVAPFEGLSEALFSLQR